MTTPRPSTDLSTSANKDARVSAPETGVRCGVVIATPAEAPKAKEDLAAYRQGSSGLGEKERPTNQYMYDTLKTHTDQTLADRPNLVSRPPH